MNKEKLLHKIQDDVANDMFGLMYREVKDISKLFLMVPEIAKIYAIECCEAQKIECAKHESYTIRKSKDFEADEESSEFSIYDYWDNKVEFKLVKKETESEIKNVAE